jgi:hypothetical protein
MEAAETGVYHSPWGQHPTIQLLTVRELIEEGSKARYGAAPGSRCHIQAAPGIGKPGPSSSEFRRPHRFHSSLHLNQAFVKLAVALPPPAGDRESSRNEQILDLTRGALPA